MFSQAEAYERFMGRWSQRLAPELVRFARVAGRAILDVGSGTGSLAFALHAALPDARVVGVDPSEAYVSLARARAKDASVRFEVGDARALPFPDASFDATLSSLVLNFVADPARAIAEFQRVTKPGGTIAAAVWDYGGEMTMLRAFWDEAVAIDPAAASRDEAHMPLCKDGELAAAFERASLRSVEQGTIAIDLGFESGDDYWAPFLLGQGPAGAFVASLDDDRRDALAARLRVRLGDGPFTMRARAWTARATT